MGRDRIDHPAGAHDDLSNAAAGALVLASEGSGYFGDGSWVCGRRGSDRGLRRAGARPSSVFREHAMVTTMTRRARDKDVFDDELYDRRYYPREVFKDGKGPRVPLMLTERRAAPAPAHLRRIAPSSAPGPPQLRADARGAEDRRRGARGLH